MVKAGIVMIRGEFTETLSMSCADYRSPDRIDSTRPIPFMELLA
jgi:hypothetical protein